jgi:prepilin-type N-terminal cleavage/methylation domain-containing protein
MRARGFTLIEVVIAMFIAAIMFAIGYGAINQALRDRDALNVSQERVTEIQLGMRVVERGRAPCSPCGRHAGRVTARDPHRGPPPTGARARAPKRRGADKPEDYRPSEHRERGLPRGHPGARRAPHRPSLKSGRQHGV